MHTYSSTYTSPPPPSSLLHQRNPSVVYKSSESSSIKTSLSAFLWPSGLNLSCSFTPSLFPHQSQTKLVKLDSRDTPPPLHFSPAVSDRERSSTAETTPIGTPRGFAVPLSRRPDKEKENWLSWHNKHSGFGGPSYGDSTLLDSDLDDTVCPLLFDDPDPILNMATPIDIATTSRATSPRNTQTSNLTSALQSTSGNEARSTTAMDLSRTPFKGFGGFGGFGGVGAATPGSQPSEAQPISMNGSNREKPRRESLASSMVTGMSWGGNSVGSWIRDEYVSTVEDPRQRELC